MLVARQPIYDPSLRVVGYELVVQRRDGTSAPGAEADASSAISEIGLSLVVGKLAYIPVSRAFLLEGFATTLPADRVVLKVSSDAQLDRAALSTLHELVSAGYTLALDKFVVDGPTHQLLNLARVIGLDVHNLDRGELRRQIGRLRIYDAMLLAQNVEDHDELELCREHPFDLLQGYFFCRPQVVSERGVQINRINRVRLAAALQDPDVKLDAVQEIISRDVALSYNLLRFINSAFFSLPRRVDSIRDALVLLGVLNVRKWASLMALAGADDKPRELVVTGLVRGRMCELLARAYEFDDPDGYFTTGLFSVVDALTDTSMVELLASLPLSQEVITALLNHEGPKGRILHAVVAYERGNFAELGDLPPLGVPLSEAYAQSIAWATDATSGL